MVKEQLNELFKKYPPAIREVISSVLGVEQEFISMKNPRGVMEQIDFIINVVANKKIEKEDKKATN